MMYLRDLRITKFLAVALFIGALPVQAMLVDCSVNSGTAMTPQADCTLVEQVPPVVITGIAQPVGSPPPTETRGLAFNPPRSANPLEESTPLIVFFSIVITIFLVRTKSLNTK